MIEKSEPIQNRHGHVLGLDTALLKHIGHVSRVHDVSRQQLGKQRPAIMTGSSGTLTFNTWWIVQSAESLVYDQLVKDCVLIVLELFQVIIVTNQLFLECRPLRRLCQDKDTINASSICDHLAETPSHLSILVPHTRAHHRVGVQGIARSAVLGWRTFLTTRVDTSLSLHQCCHCDHHGQDRDQPHDALHWSGHCQLDITWLSSRRHWNSHVLSRS